MAKLTEDKRWVREPGPGQFRGQGEWVEHRGTEEDWSWLVSTGYLPTHVGAEPPAARPALSQPGDGR